MPTTKERPALEPWEPDLHSRRVDMRRIEDIAFTPMKRRVRNELITLAYGDISQKMDELLGGEDTTWVGFGQWASSTVGRVMTLPVPGLGRLISRAFADGNRDVFADVGRAHVIFLETVGAVHRSRGDSIAQQRAWTECRKRVQQLYFAPPGRPRATFPQPHEFWTTTTDPRLEGLDEGNKHQRNALMVRGLQAYRDALHTSGAERSRNILLGTCMLALHEQKLLSLAISVGFRSWVRSVTTPWQLLSSSVKWRQRDPGSWRLKLEDRWIRFATKRLVGVRLPHRRIKVGRRLPTGEDPVEILPQLPRGRQPPVYPSALWEFKGNEVLTMLWMQFGVDGRPSVCWNDLADRMAFTMAFFSHYQRGTFWRDEYGKPIRPKIWRRFPRELRRLTDRLAERIPRTPVVMAASISDEALEQYRFNGTHEPVHDAGDYRLDFSSDSEEVLKSLAYDKAMVQVDNDVVERWKLVTADDGLLSPANRAVAQRVFGESRALVFLGLLVRSLTDSYSAAAGVEVLGQISDLATDPFRRAGETAQFVDDLLGDANAWDPPWTDGGTGAYQSLVGVRRMHSLITSHLLAERWPTERFGLPINQEDTIGAALTFGVATIELFDTLNPAMLSEEERNAYTQFWLGVGVLMGAPPKAFTIAEGAGRRPLSFAEAQALAVAIRRRHRQRSKSGVRLTEALVEGISDGFPRPFYWVSSGIMLGLGESQVNALLLTANGRGRQRARFVGWLFRFVLRTPVLNRIGRWVIELIGRRWLLPFLEQGRTRPYRRPMGPSDADRLEEASIDALRWPAGCSSVEAA